MKARCGYFVKCLLLAGVCPWTPLAAQAGTSAASIVPPRLPPADFVREPDLDCLQLSPDGEHIGYIFRREGRRELGILNVADGKARSFAPGRSETAGVNQEIEALTWLSSKRLLVLTSSWDRYASGLAAIDRSFSRWLGLTGAIRWETQRDRTDFIGTIDVLSHLGPDPHRILLNDFEHFGRGLNSQWLPHVVEMDAGSGRHRMLVRNPGNVRQWLADWDGNVRFGVIKGESEEEADQLITRDADNQAWSPPRALGPLARHFWLLGVGPSGDSIYLSREGSGGRWEMATFDLKTGRVSAQPLLHAENHDLHPPELMPSYAGVPLATTLFSAHFRRLLGVRYVTDGPHEYWFAPELESVQKQFKQLHPGLVNLIVSTDAEVRRLLVLSYSAREPGFYSLVDLADGKVRPVGRRCPWIKAEEMADTYPVSCAARDGLGLHGYLTLPAGSSRQNLPMITLVHGGPWVRDVWGYDPIVQFLANRGYAVLQVNYRGSPGYGREFSEKGRKEIGGAIQDDIVDMTQWAVRQGIADPRRLAIMGASYGGYSTLFALAHSPELFQCGIALAPVTDWGAIWHDREDDLHKESFRFWSERIGNMDDETVRAHLAKVSPVNFAAAIRLPLLLAHGKRDSTVPVSQSESLAAGLGRTGHPPRTLFFGNLGHRFPRGEQGVKFLDEVEHFLAEHLARPM